jgi:hypothetical protein
MLHLARTVSPSGKAHGLALLHPLQTLNVREEARASGRGFDSLALDPRNGADDLETLSWVL